MAYSTDQGQKKQFHSSSFIEVQTSLDVPPWCVDGRYDPDSPKGPQMLGASLLPLLLAAIKNNRPFNDVAIHEYAKRLQAKGLPLGVHYGSHRHDGVSDCGFADRLIDIFAVIHANQDMVLSRYRLLHATGQIDTVMMHSIGNASTRILDYPISFLQKTGDAFIRAVASDGGHVEHLLGDHAEEVAFVNVKAGVTLDIHAMREQGRQAFNLDLWAVQDHASALGVKDEHFVTGASLLLYMATEIVLVEQKGKNPLPIAIHA